MSIALAAASFLALTIPIPASATSPHGSLLGSKAAPADEGGQPTPPPAARKAAEGRKAALAALAAELPQNLSPQDAVRARVRRAVAATVALDDASEIGRKLKASSRVALDSMQSSPAAAALLMDLKTEAAARDLAFSPVMEAPLPKGFPWPVPAGEIQVQQYPGYRKVMTGMQGAQQNGAFFKLFRHITSNDIAMTAPVEMTMNGSQDEMLDMAFLYGDPEIGEAGEAGRVEVQDIQPMTVVSIGIRGTTRSQKTLAARAELTAWLERNSSTWVQDGNPRLMGYNGPMTPRSKQFCEIQIPIARK